jgi:hypothetical protein
LAEFGLLVARDCGFFDSSVLSPNLVGPVEHELQTNAFAAINFGELAKQPDGRGSCDGRAYDARMPIELADTDRLLADLETHIKRRSNWRGKPVSYQVPEYDLAPILETAADPADDVRRWVREKLVRLGLRRKRRRIRI